MFNKTVVLLQLLSYINQSVRHSSIVLGGKVICVGALDRWDLSPTRNCSWLMVDEWRCSGRKFHVSSAATARKLKSVINIRKVALMLTLDSLHNFCFKLMKFKRNIKIFEGNLFIPFACIALRCCQYVFMQMGTGKSQ